MTRKNKNIIDVKESIQILKEGYSLHAVIYNSYQIRITDETLRFVYDWYHTTGSLVVNGRGFIKNIGVITDPEEVAIMIKNHIIENEKI